jgi:serine protease Do
MGRYSVSFIFAIVSLLAQQVSAQVGAETGLWKWTEKQPHHDSVVEVLTASGNGSGVVIAINTDKPFKGGHEGYILTAWHVIQNDIKEGSIRVGYRTSGTRSKGCKVIDFDEDKDVALIWAWIPEGVPAAKMAADAVTPGNTLEFAGLGGGSDLRGCIRHFSAIASSPSSIEKIFADAPLLPGDSGGPVFNEKQEVVGIISGGWFWFDSGAKTLTNNSKIPTTWPARACNVGPIQQMVGKISVAEIAKAGDKPSINR